MDRQCEHCGNQCVGWMFSFRVRNAFLGGVATEAVGRYERCTRGKVAKVQGEGANVFKVSSAPGAVGGSALAVAGAEARGGTAVWPARPQWKLRR